MHSSTLYSTVRQQHDIGIVSLLSGGMHEPFCCDWRLNGNLEIWSLEVGSSSSSKRFDVVCSSSGSRLPHLSDFSSHEHRRQQQPFSLLFVLIASQSITPMFPMKPALKSTCLFQTCHKISLNCCCRKTIFDSFDLLSGTWHPLGPCVSIQA